MALLLEEIRRRYCMHQWNRKLTHGGKLETFDAIRLTLEDGGRVGF